MPLSIYMGAIIPRVLMLAPSLISTCIFLALAYGARKGKRGGHSICFAIASLLSSLLLVFALYMPSDGLIFIFLPFYCGIVGGISWLVAFLVYRFAFGSRAVGDTKPVRVIFGIAILAMVASIGLTLKKSFDESKTSIAAASDTPVTELKRLLDESFDENSSVLLFLAQNPSATAEILDVICETKHSYVKPHVAKNLNTSTNCLKKLANDSNPYTRQFAEEALKKKGSE